MTRMLAPVALLFLAAACRPNPVPMPNPRGPACDDMAVSSVNLGVVDAELGTPIADATATWAGEDRDVHECESWGEGEWSCGWEVSGSITVTVEAAGYVSASETVDVGRDRCHVITEGLTLELEPLDEACLDDGMFPSIEVSVLGRGWSEGYPLHDATVTWWRDGEDPQDCDGSAHDEPWVCGWDETGLLHWRAEAPNHEAVSGTVEVLPTPDGCHAATERVDAYLDCLNC